MIVVRITRAFPAALDNIVPREAYQAMFAAHRASLRRDAVRFSIAALSAFLLYATANALFIYLERFDVILYFLPCSTVLLSISIPLAAYASRRMLEREMARTVERAQESVLSVRLQLDRRFEHLFVVTE
jgi:hypothetical protein